MVVAAYSYFILFMSIGKHFQPGKWTKICFLNFELKDFFTSFEAVIAGLEKM